MRLAYCRDVRSVLLLSPAKILRTARSRRKRVRPKTISYRPTARWPRGYDFAVEIRCSNTYTLWPYGLVRVVLVNRTFPEEAFGVSTVWRRYYEDLGKGRAGVASKLACVQDRIPPRLERSSLNLWKDFINSESRTGYGFHKDRHPVVTIRIIWYHSVLPTSRDDQVSSLQF